MPKGKAHSRRRQEATQNALREWQGYATAHSSNSTGQSSALPHFTLAQEARNTERHHSEWRSAAELRRNKVTFVSAGNMKPDDVINDVKARNQLDGTQPVETLPSASNDNASTTKVSSLPSERNSVKPSRKPSYEKLAATVDLVKDLSMKGPSGEGRDEVFVVDSVGSRSVVDTGYEAPIIRSRSPTGSDSSEDVVVFTGRRSPKRNQISRSLNGHPSHITPQPTVTESKESKVGVTLSSDPMGSTAAIESSLSPSMATSPVRNLSGRGVSGETARSRRKNRRGDLRRWKAESDDEDALLADYIAHMKDDESPDQSDANGFPSLSPLRNIADETGHEMEAALQSYAGEHKQSKAMSWSSADLEDLDALSTSDEMPEKVGHVYSKRERRSGIQFLVVGIGQTPDDARWIKSELLTQPEAIEQIQNFELEEELQQEYPESSSTSSNEAYSGDSLAEDDLELAGDELESEPDEQDLIERRKARMTDEQIARALAKQEQLGIGADEVLLFDGEEEDDNDFDWSPRASRPLSRRQRRGKNQKSHFPSAQAFADALDQDPYNGFDVMDYDRPSLKSKSKGSRGELPFELDSELELELQQSWENDRQTKKARKREREELRSQGLLGRKPGKVDMKARYPERMRMGDIKEEIKDFLLSPSESLALPPMRDRDRKFVHEIAYAFGMNSKSRGKGNSRFPVIYKTSKTKRFGTIWSIDSVFTQGRFLPRMDKHTGGKGGAKSGVTFAKRTRVGGTGKAAASYMDGDVVGASAPEIGVQNKGRAMLEKMGWSMGTALGAVNNKGILQPVEHVVKNTKAGLG